MKYPSNRQNKQIPVLISATLLFLFACQKSTNNPPSNNAGPKETKSQFNNTSFGVYKGVVIGSSGTIVFTINNGDNQVKGFLNLDNGQDTLTTTQHLVAGQPIVNANFQGRISSMTLSANADGSNSTLTNIQINGHANVTGFIIHENSNKPVFCFEGNFTGSRIGIINFTRVGETIGDTVYGLARANGDNIFVSGLSTIAGNNLVTINMRFDTTALNAQGTLTSTTLNGTWNSFSYGAGTFSSARTY